MAELFRAVMKAHDNGQEFSVYLRDEAEAQEAAAFLKATVLELTPATHAMQQVELLQKMFTSAFGYSK